jgi:AcrR family transcriptional regulator
VLTPRRDALRNREAILRVADHAFTHGSHAVPLQEIARRAGLGRATVYRHFPDRQALAAAVAAQQLELLRRAVGEFGDDPRSFRYLLRAVLSTQATMRPLVTLMREMPVRDQQGHTDTLVGILAAPFRRAQAEGYLRADLEPGDLVLVLSMMEGAAGALPAPGPDRDAAAERLIDVLIDGLFPQKRHPAP